MDLSALVSTGDFSFLPQSKNMYLRQITDAKLPLGVCGNVFVCLSYDGLETCPGFLSPYDTFLHIFDW